MKIESAEDANTGRTCLVLNPDCESESEQMQALLTSYEEKNQAIFMAFGSRGRIDGMYLFVGPIANEAFAQELAKTYGLIGAFVQVEKHPGKPN